jgi:transposase-like protein
MSVNITQFQSMSLPDKEVLSEYLLTQIATQKGLDYPEETLSHKIACPKCGSIAFVKNGLVKGKQRFLCRDCKKTFGSTTNSALFSTKLTTSQWKEYIKCMLQNRSIRKSAEIVGICVKTSFYTRHKILDTLNMTMDKNTVSGIVEMDETYLPESFKGNHAKSGFTMPRKARERGKQVKKRGLSFEQVCIGTAIDNDQQYHNGNAQKGQCVKSPP